MDFQHTFLRYGAGLLLLSTGLAGPVAHAQDSRVYSSHPLGLDVGDARPLPWQPQIIGQPAGYCCDITLALPGYGSPFPMPYGVTPLVGLHWQGIPFRRQWWMLDGSVRENDRRVYRSGSVLVWKEGDADAGIPPGWRRVILVPQP